MKAALLSISILSLGVFSSYADSTNLHPVADTTLLESFPTNNMGGVATMIAGTTPRGRARALIKFDVSQLPAGATVNSAGLTLQVVNLKAGFAVGSTFALHRLLKDWGEGASQVNIGETALPGEASWNDRFAPDQPWTPAGGGAGVDYVNAPSSEVFINGLGPYTFDSVTNNLVADIQAWIANPASNFGWILMTESEGVTYTSRRIASREDAFNPPTLNVNYSVGSSPPASPIISAVTLVGNQIHFSFNATSNQNYAVEFRAAVDTGNWATLTNIQPLPAAATIDVSDTVSDPKRFYRIRTP